MDGTTEEAESLVEKYEDFLTLRLAAVEAVGPTKGEPMIFMVAAFGEPMILMVAAVTVGEEVELTTGEYSFETGPNGKEIGHADDEMGKTGVAVEADVLEAVGKEESTDRMGAPPCPFTKKIPPCTGFESL